MPCYNAASTLDEAIESIAAQTLTDFELVAVDDGSSDGTGALLEAWVERDSRVRLHRRPHTGIVEALNAGLGACRAPLVARMDADDRAHPERLACQVAYLEQHPEVAVVGCRVEGFPRGQVRQGFQIYIEWLNSLITPEEIARQIFVESPLTHPSVLMRREWIQRVGGYQDNAWPEDYDLWLRLHQAGARLAKVPEVLLQWREHPSRLTRTDRRYSVENFLRAKARYLVAGPLQGREAVIVWGAGQMGRRLTKHLLRQGAPLAAFVDIDPAKIGRRRRGAAVIAPADLPALWSQLAAPILLAAVGARGARALIRDQLTAMGLREGEDWWAVA
jgi:cellulose synthase/poly-beta-1,6-N-acetylglucosamine synthase-like glycosyltransferase